MAPIYSILTTIRFVQRSGRFTSMLSAALAAFATLIEWDDNIPDFEVLAASADEARRRCESVLAADAPHAIPAPRAAD